MELLSGYSDAGINAFNANQNMLGNNLMNSISAQQINQQNQMAMWNAQAMAAAQPTPPGYGEVHLPGLSGSFGEAAAPGTYSPGNAGGLSSFSGSSLYGGGYNDAAGLSPSTAPNGGWQMGADGQSRYTEPTYNAPMSYGWDANEGAIYSPYNAPMSYGWQTNEGAPSPGYQPQTPRGEFNPQTYGWDHNEGAPPPNQGQQDFLDTWGRALPLYMPPVSPSTVTVPGQQSWLGGGGDFWSQYNAASAAAAGSMGSNFLSPGGGFSNSGADPWGAAWATGTPAGTRAAVPDVSSYMPSGGFGGWPADTWGANSGYLGQTGLWGNNDTAALGGYPFGGYSSQDFMSIMGWPQAQGIGNSPFAGYGATPQADINNRWGGMQEPVWSAQGLTLGDRLRDTSANTLGWSDVDNQGQKHFLGGQ
jgi:hypothetical protein